MLCDVIFPNRRTILEDALYVEAIGGAGLVVGAALQVAGQLAGSRVLDHARRALTDCVCKYNYTGYAAT